MNPIPDQERSAAEVENLREICHQLRGSLDLVEDGVLVVEARLDAARPQTRLGPRIVFCNRAACRLTGLRAEALLGEPLANFFDEDRIGALISKLPMVAGSGKRFQLKAALHGVSGTWPCRWTVRVLAGATGEGAAADGSGGRARFTFAFQRVEEEKPGPELENVAAGVDGGGHQDGAGGPGGDSARAGAGEGLEAQCKTETLAFIASGIAHDFNNVLTPVIGNLSLVEFEIPDGTVVRRRVAEARSAAEEAKALARQILDFAKGAGARKEPGDIGRILAEATKLATTGANVRCDLSLADGLWQAEINATQILNVFNNLLINARQAMPDGGVVQASARNVELAEADARPELRPGRYVEVSVRDRGCGIAQENLENIFLAFYTTKEEGTGIGLAACRSIVLEHGGEIAVTSTVDVGTEMKVYLPALGTGPGGKDGENAEEPVFEGEGSVLVVDDQDAIRTVAAAIIRKLGYEAVTARSGEEALEVYDSRMRLGKPVSAVLLDMTLPGGMSGMDTLAELLKLDPDVRTIASSGYFDEDALASHRESGYVGVLPKPYTVERLSKAVHEAIHAGV